MNELGTAFKFNHQKRRFIEQFLLIDPTKSLISRFKLRLTLIEINRWV